MADIKDLRLLCLKGALFVALGLLAGAIILLKYPDWQLVWMMFISIWAFCRAYYFAFYVIEKYMDPTFKFAGLTSVLSYFWNKQHKKSSQ
ncbi:MAG: hypothetical protein RL595_2026 [Planctomycetota bacterium]|jgi:hypothetical protein